MVTTGFKRTITVLFLSYAVSVSAADWSTWRGDINRSGIGYEAFSFPLKEGWTFKSKYPPQPAWPGPAKRDGWHKTENLKARVIFDWAYHVVASNGSVYFGSSSDDKVYCLDSQTGEEQWSFFAEAPVRLSPMVYEGRVYFGSDDGYAYCLDAKDGSLVWKFLAAPSEYRVPGNSRMISLWPVRTGVLADNGTAYFCSGLFPNEGIYMYAVDAANGELKWKQRIDDYPPQGYLLASATKLYVPTGRGTPVVFNRENGEFLHQVDGSGGTFAVLTGDMLISGPGKTGELDFSSSESKDHLATFSGNQIIVTPERTYLHSDTELSVLDRVRHSQLLQERGNVAKEIDGLRRLLRRLGRDADTEEAKNAKDEMERLTTQLKTIDVDIKNCILWTVPCKYPYSLILSGDTLFAGGTDEIAAFDGQTGELKWSSKVNGRALELASAGHHLLVSTDQGYIHTFTDN